MVEWWNELIFDEGNEAILLFVYTHWGPAKPAAARKVTSELATA